MIVHFRYLIIESLCLLSLGTTMIVPSICAQRKTTRQPQTEQTSQSQQISTSIPIKWHGQPGVQRYRLQLARDENFTDIVFDRAVVGLEYTVTGLAPGSYYWRVAPAPDETGTFSKPAPVEVSNTPPEEVRRVVITPSSDVGWRTATGEVPRPLSARLRTTKNYDDFVAVNTDGTVYALDGASGEAMWTARFRPTARRGEVVAQSRVSPFVPIIIPDLQGQSHVIVAFDGGVRALRGETGSELWRVMLSGRANSGVAADIDGDGKAEVAVVADNPSTLYILDGGTGRIVSQTKLPGAIIGAPVPYTGSDGRGIALSLEGGLLDLRRIDGSRAKSAKFDAALTTPPLIVESGRGPLILVGIERGLLALSATDLRPLGRIATENDMPRGTLAAMDIDGDGAVEVAMVTQRGKVALINTSDGKIRWHAEGASDADSVVFADVNGDGVLDVLAAAGAAFALGFSGRDGSLVWRGEEGRTPPAPQTPGPLRGLAVVSLNDGAAFVVGGDPARTGLRALGLPKGSLKTIAKRAESEPLPRTPK